MVINMSNRCTKSTLMYKGGQVDLAKCTVWWMKDGVITRIKDSTVLKDVNEDVEIMILPQHIKDETDFHLHPKDQIIKKITSAKRALGGNHLDTPLNNEEVNKRKELVQRWGDKLVSSLVQNPGSRDEARQRLEMVLTEKMLHCGEDLVIHHLAKNTNNSSSLPALIRSLELLPTMAERAGAPSAYGLRSRIDRTSQPLSALNPVPGKKPTAILKVNKSDPRSIHPHALARYMERVDDRIDSEIIELTKDMIRTRNTREMAEQSRSTLANALRERGLTKEYLSDVIDKLSKSLTDPHNKPIFSSTTPHIVGNQHDRAVLLHNIEGEDYEILVRAADSKKISTDSVTVNLEIISLWPISKASQREDVWVDKDIPEEYRNEWALKLQEKIVEAIRR